jgi:UDP-2,3-diacylglucosamine hydrolase
MRHIFIADAHLRGPTDHNYRMLLRFLSGLRGTTDTLFIMGDLFEFWIGHRTVPYSHYLPVLEALRDLRLSGTHIVYFEGNHDFHMGPFFEETLQARLFTGPALFELEGKKVFLCHGDQMNEKDYPYRLLRLVFHSRLTKALALMVPPAVPSFIADRLGRRSRKSHKSNREKWDYRSIIRSFAAARFAAGCDIVVTGHFHLPFREQVADEPLRLIVSLGDWITHFTYGEWSDGTIVLKRFSDEEDGAYIPNS